MPNDEFIRAIIIRNNILLLNFVFLHLRLPPPPAAARQAPASRPPLSPARAEALGDAHPLSRLPGTHTRTQAHTHARTHTHTHTQTHTHTDAQKKTQASTL